MHLTNLSLELFRYHRCLFRSDTISNSEWKSFTQNDKTNKSKFESFILGSFRYEFRTVNMTTIFSKFKSFVFDMFLKNFIA